MTSDLTSFAHRLRSLLAQDPRSESSLAAFDEAHFNALALDLFTLQFHHNAPYRTLCEARGVTPGKVEHWSRIPAVPTAAFKELELTCVPSPLRTTIFNSSRTTGQTPSRHFHGALSLALYDASLWPWFDVNVLAGLETGKWLCAILTPPPALAPHSSLIHMFEIVRQRGGAFKADYFGGVEVTDEWTLDCLGVEQAIRGARQAEQPLVLLGTAFNYVHLLDYLVARGLHLDLPVGSRVMETGGYKGRSRELPQRDLHGLITNRLGVGRSNIICEYGMSELSSQAYDTGASRVFRFPPWCRMQVISPETGREVAEGETGLLRIFDLANAFSVQAVQTEDMAVRRDTGFELVGRAVDAEPRGCSLMPAETCKS